MSYIYFTPWAIDDVAKQNGTMIIYEKERNEYFGVIQVNYIHNGSVVAQLFHELSLYRNGKHLGYQSFKGNGILKQTYLIDKDIATSIDVETRFGQHEG
jgi:hypothetical protein